MAPGCAAQKRQAPPEKKGCRRYHAGKINGAGRCRPYVERSPAAYIDTLIAREISTGT